MNKIREQIEAKYSNALIDLENEHYSNRDGLIGNIEAYMDLLALIPKPRTEEEILKDIEEYYAIVKNDEYELVLIDDCDTIISVDKKCQRYDCYYYSEGANKLELTTYVDMTTHKLLNELFECWEWL